MLEAVSHWVIELISNLGYPGIVITMAIESALIPLPSEIIMPFSGYLGNERVVRRFLRNYGKWILHTEEDLDDAEKLLHKYKDLVVLGTRVLPGIRTVISLPCGIARLPLLRFSI